MTLHEIEVAESMKILVLETELEMMANGHGDRIHEN